VLAYFSLSSLANRSTKFLLDTLYTCFDSGGTANMQYHRTQYPDMYNLPAQKINIFVLDVQYIMDFIGVFYALKNCQLIHTFIEYYVIRTSLLIHSRR